MSIPNGERENAGKEIREQKATQIAKRRQRVGTDCASAGKLVVGAGLEARERRRSGAAAWERGKEDE